MCLRCRCCCWVASLAALLGAGCGEDGGPGSSADAGARDAAGEDVDAAADAGHPEGPWIVVVPDQIVFGVEPSGARVRQPLTVRSVGTEDLEVVSVELVTDAPETLFLAASPASPWVIPAGTEAGLEVEYAPYGADDTPEGTVVFVSNDGWVGPVEVPVVTGAPLPGLRLEPGRLSWERVAVLEPPAPGCDEALAVYVRELSVVSAGSAPLHVTGFELTPAEEREHFTVCPAPFGAEEDAVSPGDSRSWRVVFHPLKEARPVADLRIDHEGGFGTVNLRAAAGPGPGIEASPPELSWAGLAPEECADRELTLGNGGQFATAVTLVRLNPAAIQAAYTVSGDTWDARQQRLSAPIRPGEQAVLTVGYCAPAEGPATGALELHHTAIPEVESPIRVPLLGH